MSVGSVKPAGVAGNGVDGNPIGNDGAIIAAGGSAPGDGRRRRGTPIVIDPAGVIGPDTGASGGDSEPRAKRKYTRRAANSGGTQVAPLDISGLETILLSCHTMLAAMTGVQEFILSSPEAHELASAMSNVSRHYDVGATQKTLDWVNLATVAGAVYGTRILAASNRRKASKAEKTVSDVAPGHAAGGDTRTVSLAMQ